MEGRFRACAILSTRSDGPPPPVRMPRESGDLMTEILTESFCERCGTRYTFESARPKTRLTGVKVLSRGLKNFVMSDDTSMDEAMAAARSETDRESTAHQLDAFHKTFNFCMSCRQYTCPNCWNEVEARCLSCAPHLGHEVLPAPFPDLPSGPLVSDPAAFGDPFPATDGVTAANGTNGAAAKGAELIGFAEVQAKRDEEIDAAARLAALTAAPTPVAEPEPLVVEPEAFVAAAAASHVVEPEITEPDVPADTDDFAASAAPVAEPPAATPLVPDVPPAPAAPLPADAPNPYDDVDPSTPTWLKALVVGSAADDVRAAEPPAAERPAAAAAPAPVVEPEPVALAPQPVIEPEPPSVEPEPLIVEPEPIAQALPLVEPEPPIVEPEPEPVAAAVPEPTVEPEPQPLVADPEPERLAFQIEPVAEASPEPVAPAAPLVTEPVPAPTQQPPVQPAVPAPDLAAAATASPATPATLAATDDVVAQPVWQIVAPDDATSTVNGAAPARSEPQWPAQPQWPERTPAGGLPFLNRPATPTGGLDALWAESTREVVASPSKNGKPANVVQPCVNCGLSLSANARFCRRCGTPQGS